jgi:hypothetical protein
MELDDIYTNIGLKINITKKQHNVNCTAFKLLNIILLSYFAFNHWFVG